MTKTQQHRFRLEIITTGKTNEEATRGLRGLLKCLLRGFGFRCTSVEQLPDPEANEDDQ